MNEEQSEILGLLQHEFEAIAQSPWIEMRCDEREFSNDDNDQEQAENLLADIENLGGALNLANLPSLAETCLFIIANLRALPDSGKESEIGLAKNIALWAEACTQVITSLNQGKPIDTEISHLVALLSTETWHQRPDDSLIQNLITDQPTDTDLPEHQFELPDEVSESMCSLSYAEGVRVELIQSLKQELPSQARDFEQAVSNFQNLEHADDLHTAQRIAHTVKGAANIVGMSGLANLMHWTEELLEIILKRNYKHREATFFNLLTDLSDSLNEISEFTLDIGPAPSQLSSVLSQLLDFLRDVRHQDAHPATEAIPKEGAQLEDSEHLNASSNRQGELSTQDIATSNTAQGGNAEHSAGTHQPAIPEKPPSDENDTQYLTIPETLAHNLLRISGETQIATSQTITQIETLNKALESSEQHHLNIADMSSQLEKLIQQQSAVRSSKLSLDQGEMDPLEMERFSELHSFSHKLTETCTDSFDSIKHLQDQVKALTSLCLSVSQFNRDSQDILLNLRLVRVDSIFSRFERCVRQANKMTGKSARLVLKGGEQLIDSRVLNRIANPIMHLLRNAIDHGLEGKAEARAALGKIEDGTIELSFASQGEVIQIILRDDGQGLDFEKIREKAIANGYMDKHEIIDENTLKHLIAMPGFSTRDQATQTSGRGIGLDVVAKEIKSLKGSFNIHSEKNVGCVFTISIPTSILSAHALIVSSKGSAGDHTVGVLSRNIESIVYVEDASIVTKKSGAYYQMDGDLVPIVHLNDLLKIHRIHHAHRGALLLVRRPDNTPIAVAVDTILKSQELIVKPLNRFAYRGEGVVGATILGDGEVSAVVDLLDIPNLHLSEEKIARLQKSENLQKSSRGAGVPEVMSVLIVDDSLSARRSLTQFIADMGMEVSTAKDGFEAIAAIERKRPAFILADLEMPRMNGLELTSHLRSREETKDIPVIMITSRTTEKHKHLAQKAGVNEYLSKPWSDEELLDCIQTQIA